MLSFTCDEAWWLYRPDAEPSVHLTLLPEGLERFRDDRLAAQWLTIRAIRRVVTGALEVERAAKRIGSSLQASPIIYLPKEYMEDLSGVDWAEVCITSSAKVVELKPGEDAPRDAFKLEDAPGIGVVVEEAKGTKCARSWKILPTVGSDPEYPDVSPRDAQALREWNALGEIERPRFDERTRHNSSPLPLWERGAKSSETRLSRVRGQRISLRNKTPHPPSLRLGTLSHKGRGEEGCNFLLFLLNEGSSLMPPLLRSGLVAAVAGCSIRPQSSGY